MSMESACGGQGGEGGREAEGGRVRMREKKRKRERHIHTHPKYPCNSWDVRNYDGGIGLRIINMNSNTFAHLQL